jgi:choline dehydrogenase-like flavoprotein
VVVVESGGLQFDADTQSLYRGQNVGLRYFPLETARLRYFGGTTNHWGGMCRPFEDEDFARQAWLPHSGWPLAKRAIDPYYARALPIVQLRENAWSPDDWAEADKPALPFATDRLVNRIHQRAGYDEVRVRFGEVYREALTRATNVVACLHGNAVRIETDRVGRTVTRIHFGCLGGNRFSVQARFFVLATGAIENARLLLLSTERHPAGLGNDHDLVGRFFADHPQFLAGIVRLTDPGTPLGLYRPHRARNSSLSASAELAERVRRDEALGRVWLDFRTTRDEHRARTARRVASLRYIVSRLRAGAIPDDFGRHLANIAADLGARALGSREAVAAHDEEPIDHIRLTAVLAPAPNPDSRVTLGSELDQLGQRRVTLDWRLSPIDKRSVRRTVEVLAMELGRTGLGRVQTVVDASETTWPDDLVGSGHQIGTTRMSDDPKQGVVDANCRVHGISNLFIAGSAVFPTAGSGTPTLLIVALALRLADHLKVLVH